jgi:hypothetical protein
VSGNLFDGAVAASETSHCSDSRPDLHRVDKPVFHFYKIYSVNIFERLFCLRFLNVVLLGPDSRSRRFVFTKKTSDHHKSVLMEIWMYGKFEPTSNNQLCFV